MKICHYMWGNNIGGIWALVKIISKQQSVSNEVGILFTKMNQELTADNVKYYEVRFLHNFDFRPVKIRKAREIFRNYDIIHLHTVFFPVFLAAVLSRNKIIFTIHGLALPDKGSHLSVTDRIRLLIVKHILRYRVRVVTTVSSNMRHLLEHHLKTIKNIRVIYNCSKFSETDFLWKEEISNGPLKILTFSRMVPGKRIEYIPAILEILRTRDINAQADIYGEGPAKDQIENIITSKDLPIILHNFTASIKEAITNADICVFPFKGETFGIAALEVLSIGRIPIVFEDGGGLVEIMKPIASGRFVVKDIMACADLIQEISLDRSILLKYKHQIFERIKEFRVEKIVDQYQLLYENA
jgi:glycosyltransferase involved in cell wall biosynthesis